MRTYLLHARHMVLTPLDSAAEWCPWRGMLGTYARARKYGDMVMTPEPITFVGRSLDFVCTINNPR